jgi:hypothetical protein
MSNHPAILIKPWKKMAINRNVLRSLGSPKYIQFWWSDSENTLLISNAKNDTPSTYCISDYSYKLKGNMNIRSLVFLRAVINTTQWHENTAYAILGEYVPELDMVAFRASEAIKTDYTGRSSENGNAI